MNRLKVRAHTCYLGRTGYNAHARGFFRELSKLVDLRVRNYTWDENPDYLNEVDLSILDTITLGTGHHTYADFPIAENQHFKKFNFTTPKTHFSQDVDIVLMDMNHHYFYEDFTSKVKIAYTVWESTRLPDYFVDKLIEKFDYVWVVTEWHKNVLSDQGYPKSRIHVVNEAVDLDFFPQKFDDNFTEYKDNRFKFTIFGRWDFRKSVPEIIDAFLKEFKKDEAVDLVLSVDNPYAVDGMNSTEERLTKYDFIDERLKVKHFVERKDYIKYITNGHVMITCARSEGWNIPLIESLAAGVPALFTDYGAQLEFARHIGIPVKVKGTVPCLSGDTYNVQALAGTEVPGYYAAPDYEDLRKKMRYAYENYQELKEKALVNSLYIRKTYTWKNAADQAMCFLTSVVEQPRGASSVISPAAIQRIPLGKDSLDWALTRDAFSRQYAISFFGTGSQPVDVRISSCGRSFVVQVNNEEKHFAIPEKVLAAGLELAVPSFERKVYLSQSSSIGVSKFYDSSLQEIPLESFAKEKTQERKINIHYVDGPFVEILDSTRGQYSVEFIDNEKNELVHSSVIDNNCWTRANRKWYTDWKIVIKDVFAGEVIQESRIDLQGKRVFVCFESSSLGDNIAWIPYVEEFRKKHQCKILVSTFYNDLFASEYPEMEFLERGQDAKDIIATYRLGWFYDGNSSQYDECQNPSDFRDQAMQKAASDILGLDYLQIRPKIAKPSLPPSVEGKYVCIGIHSTTQAKYWNKESAWQDVVDFLAACGYKVVLISKESGDYMGNKIPAGIINKAGSYSLEDRINDLMHADFYIGLGSGLSWLAWGVGTPAVLISGFSKPETEFSGDDVIRIFNPDSCNSCFNRHRLDAGDWNWCPDWKGTPRQFECTKTISSKMVIDQLKKFMK
jgi:autotransporter strand-loop-strand O-heptosyltransferase